LSAFLLGEHVSLTMGIVSLAVIFCVIGAKKYTNKRQ
jgi:hypothetical protein